MHSPVFVKRKFDFPKSAQSRNRTSDTWIFSPLLYHLSYLGICSRVTVRPLTGNLPATGIEPVRVSLLTGF